MARDLMQVIMGLGFKKGALRNPVIKQAFDHALFAIRLEERRALERYWDLNTGRKNCNMEEVASSLGTYPSTIRARLGRAYNLIRHQLNHTQDETLRTELEKLSGWLHF